MRELRDGTAKLESNSGSEPLRYHDGGMFYLNTVLHMHTHGTTGVIPEHSSSNGIPVVCIIIYRNSALAILINYDYYSAVAIVSPLLRR